MDPNDLLRQFFETSSPARAAAFLALVEYLVRNPEQRLAQAMVNTMRPPSSKEGFVIRYEDGCFNMGVGFPVGFHEADVYPTWEKAQEILPQIDNAEILDIREVVDFGPQPEAFYLKDEDAEARIRALLG